MPAVINFISKAWRAYSRHSGPGHEMATLALAAAFGLLVLPVGIWVGGHLVLGEYVRDASTGVTGGPLALWLDYLRALAAGSPGYWIACAGPYVIYLILRLLKALLRL